MDVNAPALVHVCSFYRTNPVHERLFTELHAQTGLQQIVVVPVKKPVPARSAESAPFGRVVQLHCLDLATSASSRHRGRRIVRALRRHGLWDELAALEVVRVHAHSAYMDGFAAACIARHAGAGYCLTFRATDTDFCFRYRPWATLFMRRIARGAHALLTISRGDLDRVADRLSLDRGRVQWLGSGVDDDCAAGALLRKPHRATARTTFVTTGKRGYPYKRVDLTIAACDAAAQQLGLEDWTLRVLGMTSEDYRRTHGRRAGAPPPGERVEFLGRVSSRTELLAILREASQFVLPSRETFGIVFLEAVSQCTPIVWLRDYAVEGVFDGTWVGEPARSQALEHVVGAIVATARRSGGALGPFDRNPVSGLGWDSLARRYRRAVLDDRAATGVADGAAARGPDDPSRPRRRARFAGRYSDRSARRNRR